MLKQEKCANHNNTVPHEAYNYVIENSIKLIKQDLEFCKIDFGVEISHCKD